MIDTCICCGFIIPEGRQICTSCKTSTINVNCSFIVGVDMNEGDVPTIVVTKHKGSYIEIINTITGPTAEAVYKILTNK